AWKIYYSMKNKFADVKYNYAITAHKCLPLSSKIHTFAGIKNLKEINRNNWLISGKGRIQKVKESVYTGLKNEYIIKTRSGRTFISSEEHRYLSNGQFIAANELQPGNYLNLWRQKESIPFEFDLNYWTIGYIVGDGYYGSGNEVSVTFQKGCSSEKLIREFFEQYVDSVETKNRPNTNTCLIRLANKHMRNYLLSKGIERVVKTEKKTPNFTCRKDKANFIRGLFDADGSCDSNRAVIRFVNISEHLIDEVAMLLQEFGII